MTGTNLPNNRRPGERAVFARIRNAKMIASPRRRERFSTPSLIAIKGPSLFLYAQAPRREAASEKEPGSPPRRLISVNAFSAGGLEYSKTNSLKAQIH